MRQAAHHWTDSLLSKCKSSKMTKHLQHTEGDYYYDIQVNVSSDVFSLRCNTLNEMNEVALWIEFSYDSIVNILCM